MPTALLTGYPHHARAIARFVNKYASRWHLVAEGTDFAARNRALRYIPFVDALLQFGGPAPDALIAAATRRRNKPVAVAWAGSDVVELASNRAEAARIRCRPFRHVACSSSLAEELRELGIPAKELRLVVAEPPPALMPLPERFTVLAYCPVNTEYLYGVDIIRDVARSLPHVHFDIIGGCKAASEIDNVTYRGWLDDIAPAIDASTVVLRPTRHDGMPLMVLEALARGRHVIWSRRLEGAITARTADEIAPILETMESSHRQQFLQLNEPGVRAVNESFSPEAVTREVERFLDELVTSAETKHATYAAVSRRKAVVSGSATEVAAFLERMAVQAPQWDIHPLIGQSRSERLDDALAMLACERWFSLDETALDPIVQRVAAVCRKTAVPVRPDAARIPSIRSLRQRRTTRVRLSMEEWKAFDAAHPAPTFFSRPAWALALERTYPWMTAEPTLFYLPEGEVLLPFMRSGSRFTSIEAMPLGTYTIPLSPDGGIAKASAVRAIAQQLMASCESFTCTTWPLIDAEALGECAQVPHQAAVIDLRGGMEAAISGFKGVARRMAGQAQRKGVRVARESGAAEVYYRLLEDSAKRWGLQEPHLPRAIFDALDEVDDGSVEFWIARFEGEAIAAGVMMYGSTEAFFWSAAMRSQFSSLRPNNLLNVEMIKGAVERGMQWYNLGASDGLAGVERFKESLGAELRDYVTSTWRSPIYRRYKRVRSGFFVRQPATLIKAATI